MDDPIANALQILERGFGIMRTHQAQPPEVLNDPTQMLNYIRQLEDLLEGATLQVRKAFESGA